MMKSFFKFLFCLLILFTGFSNTHAQSDTTKYKVYFKIDSTTVGEKAVLSMLTINKIDGAAISSFDVDSCFYLTKGLYKVEYVCQIGYQGDWYSAMRDIKSDTTITLKPLKGVATSIGTEYALIFNLKWYDSESIAEIMHKINMKGVFNFHSKNTTEQYLENYLRDSLSNDKSNLKTYGFANWELYILKSDPAEKEYFTELPSPFVFYHPLTDEQKAANSFYLFNAHEDQNGNLEFRAITTEKQDDEYIELTADGNFLKVSVKYLSTFTLVHSSGYTVNYYVNNKKVSSSYGVSQAIDKPTDSYGSNDPGWYTADNTLYDFDTELTGDLNLYANVKTAGSSEVIKPVYYSISGTVSDVMGNPVADAVVTLKQSKTVINRDTTDAAGYYSIGKLDNTKYDLSVSAGSNYGTYACDGIQMGSNPIHDIVLSLTSTDINDASLAAVQVMGQQGALRILNGTPGKLYQIVSVSGAVTKGFITGTDQTIPLSPGFYIVLLNGKSMKVIVR